jgi:hypothetical protein
MVTVANPVQFCSSALKDCTPTPRADNFLFSGGDGFTGLSVFSGFATVLYTPSLESISAFSQVCKLYILEPYWNRGCLKVFSDSMA